MICPHCNKKSVFQATEPVEVLPTFENWAMDELSNPIDTIECICVECSGYVNIRLRNRIIVKVRSRD